MIVAELIDLLKTKPQDLTVVTYGGDESYSTTSAEAVTVNDDGAKWYDEDARQWTDRNCLFVG